MNKAIKKVAHRFLDPALYNLLARRYHSFGPDLKELIWQYSWAGYRNRLRLYRLHNKYSGRRCFIIGNGPSLAETDLRPLAHEITIGCNCLFFMFDKIGFIPTFYTVEDSLLAEDRAEQINRIKDTTKIFPRALSYSLLPDNYTIFINFKRERFEDRPKFSDRFDKVVYWGGTVTYLNLQLAYYIGCNEVYLIGVDHNYTIPTGLSEDQDAVIVSTSTDPNHFHPDYFGPGYRYHNPQVTRMEKGYLATKQFFDRHGMKIFNATKGGKLEVFTRVRYENVISGSGGNRT